MNVIRKQITATYEKELDHPVSLSGMRISYLALFILYEGGGRKSSNGDLQWYVISWTVRHVAAFIEYIVYTTAVEKWTIILDKNKGYMQLCAVYSCSTFAVVDSIRFCVLSISRQLTLICVPQQAAAEKLTSSNSWPCYILILVLYAYTKPEKININTSCWTRPVSKLYKVVKFPSTLCSYIYSSLASPPRI